MRPDAETMVPTPHPSRSSGWRCAGLALAVLLSLGSARSAVPEDDPVPGARPLGERVGEAIDRGVAWLLASARRARVAGADIAHWGLIGGETNYEGGTGIIYTYPAGLTALALYTLLKCGVPPEHPLIAEGFAWLQTPHSMDKQLDGSNVGPAWRVSYRVPGTSYEIAASLLALTAKHMPEKRSADAAKRPRHIADKADRAWAEELVRALIAKRGVGSPPDEAERMRGWRYNTERVLVPTGADGPETRQVSPYPPPGNEDLSSTQLAALALFAASRLGVDVPGKVWADIAAYTLDAQEADGPEHARHVPAEGGGTAEAVKDRARGFCYAPGSPLAHEARATGAMTACGVANLLMARQGLDNAKGGRRAWDARKLGPPVERAIADGLAWLDLNWSPFENPGHPTGLYHTYYLYALERSMDLLGRELVGAHAWYPLGAEELLKRTLASRVRRLLDGQGGETDAFHWETGRTHIPSDLLDTCFALLFLKRSTRSLAVVTSGG